ncbi:UM00103-like protein [Meredithblackwellia eburnea MCA 4105]
MSTSPSISGNTAVESREGERIVQEVEELTLGTVEGKLEMGGRAGQRLKGDDLLDDVCPDGGYGWVVVCCTMGINAVTWGINTTYGVYSSFYLSHSYFPGGTPLRYAFVGGASVATAVVIAPFSNFLSKRYGFRLPLLIGAVGVVLGQCCAGVAPNFGVFLLCQGIIFGIGLGLTFVPAVPLIAHWFDKRLSLAQGLSAGGSGLGGLIFANVTRVTIEKLGVKWALVINGIASLVVLTPSILLLKGRTQELKAKSEPLQIKWVFHRGYVWVWTWGSLAMVGYFVALYSLASFATNGIGLSQTKGAALQSMLAAGQMIGRPLCGRLLDRFGRLNMAIILQVISGCSCLFIWYWARSFGVLSLFAWVQGLVGGTVWATVAPVSARVVGVQDLQSSLAIFWLSVSLPAQFGQPMAIALLNYSKNQLGRTGADAYLISIGFCGGCFIASGLLMFGAKFHHQKSFKLWVKV